MSVRMTLEEISPERFLWELYDANGIHSLSEDLYIAKSVGYCDASRLQVRPRAGMVALMIEFEDGTKHWFHGTERTLKSVRSRLEIIHNKMKG
jgi:hypothetical protein